MVLCQRMCLVCALILSFPLMSHAKVTLPPMFQDGMVLQRGKPITIWGKADAHERVALSLGRYTGTVVADAAGRWSAVLPVMRAGGPYVMHVGDKTISDVLVGDVWLCSGQSNMDVMVSRVYPQYASDIDRYANDKIRLLRAEQRAYVDGVGHEITTSGWHRANKKDAWNFSALGYFLARRMYERTKVPQGIICNSWGGTPIEAWVPRDSLLTGYAHYTHLTQLYTPEYVETQQRANQLMSQQWNQQLDARDTGLHQGWMNEGYDDSSWSGYQQYSDGWSRRGGHGLVGSVWMRQHVQVDAAHAGREALLNLGTLYDMDYGYVNGRQVGVTYYQYPPRRYTIPAGVLHEGDNVVSIRFVTKQGTPSFTRGKKYQIEFADSTVIRLSETWLSRVGAEMPPLRTMDVSTQNLPYILYQSMLAPIAPYTLAGCVWYQGESNTGKPEPYAPMLRKLTGAWRAAWHDAELPFVVVQLANYMSPSAQPQQSGWAQVREAQRTVAAEDPRTELAVTIDLGEWNDIHPLRKREVADRVALALRHQVYRDKVTLSPVALAAEPEGGAVVLTFDQPLRGGRLHEFEVAGADGVFHNAEAVCEGRCVKLTADKVGVIHRVRYAWKHNPDRADVYGLTGLPASPFQMDVTHQ